MLLLGVWLLPHILITSPRTLVHCFSFSVVFAVWFLLCCVILQELWRSYRTDITSADKPTLNTVWILHKRYNLYLVYIVSDSEYAALNFRSDNDDF